MERSRKVIKGTQFDFARMRNENTRSRTPRHLVIKLMINWYLETEVFCLSTWHEIKANNCQMKSKWNIEGWIPDLKYVNLFWAFCSTTRQVKQETSWWKTLSQEWGNRVKPLNVGLKNRTGCQPSPKQELHRYSIADIRRVCIEEFGRSRKIEKRKIPTAVADVSTTDKIRKVKVKVKNLVLHLNTATKYAKGRYLEKWNNCDIFLDCVLCPNEINFNKVRWEDPCLLDKIHTTEIS